MVSETSFQGSDQEIVNISSKFIPELKDSEWFVPSNFISSQELDYEMCNNSYPGSIGARVGSGSSKINSYSVTNSSTLGPSQGHSMNVQNTKIQPSATMKIKPADMTDLSIDFSALFDGVCFSELNTPDISAFDNIDKPEFDWNSNPVVDDPSDNGAAMKNPQDNLDLFTDSPSFDLDIETSGDQQMLENLEPTRVGTPVTQDTEISAHSYNKLNNIIPILEEKIMAHFYKGVVSEQISNNVTMCSDTQNSDVYTPHIDENSPHNLSTNENSMPLGGSFEHSPENNQMLCTDSQSIRDTCQLNSRVRVTHPEYEKDCTGYAVRGLDIKSDNIMESYKEQIANENLYDLFYDTEPSFLDAINNEQSEKPSNVLKEAGLDDYEIDKLVNPCISEISAPVQAKTTDELFNSFIAKDSAPVATKQTQQFQGLHILSSKRETKFNSAEDILKSFKASAYGKGLNNNNNNIVLKSVKIAVPANHKKDFATFTNQSLYTGKPQFIIQPIELKSHINEQKSEVSNPSRQLQYVSKPKVLHSGSALPTIAYEQIAVKPAFRCHSNAPSVPSTSGHRGSKRKTAHSDSVITPTTSCQRRNPRMSQVKRTSVKDEIQFSDSDDDITCKVRGNNGDRLSLKGLSEAEKYRRIREQNNIASKKCREKRKQNTRHIAVELLQLEKMNKRLTAQYELLERRKTLMEKLVRDSYRQRLMY